VLRLRVLEPPWVPRALAGDFSMRRAWRTSNTDQRRHDNHYLL